MKYTIRCHYDNGNMEYDTWFAGFREIEGERSLRWYFKGEEHYNPLRIDSIHEARKILNCIIMDDIAEGRTLNNWYNFIEETE